MSVAAEKFDNWIRTSFVEMNTALEEVYFAQDDPAQVEAAGGELKSALLDEGQALIAPLAAEGNTDKQFDAGPLTCSAISVFFLRPCVGTN